MSLLRQSTSLQALLLTSLCILTSEATAVAQTEPTAADVVFPQYLPAEHNLALSPMRAQIRLSLEGNADTLQRWQAELNRLLQNHWMGTVGFEIISASKPSRLSTVPLDLTRPEHLADTEIELQLRHVDGVYLITSRYWLRLTDSWADGPTFEIQNESLVPRYLARAATSLQQPLLHIQDVDADRCSGVVAGGERIAPESPSGTGLITGDLLQPLLIYTNRNGELVRRQSIPWTYLQVQNLRRGQATADIASAFRAPLPAARRRVEIFAVRVPSFTDTTSLLVRRRGQTERPYPLAQVYISPWNSTPADSDETTDAEQPPPSFNLTCNRNGRVELETADLLAALGTSLVKIEVLSGDSVVARVPWAVGSSSELELSVPDDTARLTAIESLDQVETDLLRVAAKRATLLAALRQLADQARDVDASPLWTELVSLPGSDQFARRITLIRVSAVEALTKLGNRTAARQVEKACETTSLLVNKHLANGDLEELKQRLNLDEFTKQQAAAAAANEQDQSN